MDGGMKWQCVTQRCRARITVGSLQRGQFQLSMTTPWLMLPCLTNIQFSPFVSWSSWILTVPVSCSVSRRDELRQWMSIILQPFSFLKDPCLPLLSTQLYWGSYFYLCQLPPEAPMALYLSCLTSPTSPQYLKPFHYCLGSSSSPIIYINPCPYPIFWMFL